MRLFKHFLETFLTFFHKNNSLIQLSLIFENFYAFLRGISVSFSFDKKNKFFLARENNSYRYYSEISRFFWLYRNGINKRGEFLFESYRLNNIKFDKNDIVIDCGANAGDLFLILKDKLIDKNYIGIEPNPVDFQTLSLNCPNSTLINKALSNKNSHLKFYICTSDGDSSIIEPKKYDKVIKVPTVTLDSMCSKLNISSIKLLKLEAEGFEPEILSGASKTLKKCEYVAIDGGYERGNKEEQTFTTLSNILIKDGFEMIDVFFDWQRAIFKNTNL